MIENDQPYVLKSKFLILENFFIINLHLLFCKFNKYHFDSINNILKIQNFSLNKL